MRTLARTFSLVVALAVCGVACSDDDGGGADAAVHPDGQAAGTEGGPCYGNGTCNTGLTCASSLCVRVPDSATPDMSADSQPLDASVDAPTDSRADTPPADAAPCTPDDPNTTLVDEDSCAQPKRCINGACQVPPADAGADAAQPPPGSWVNLSAGSFPMGSQTANDPCRWAPGETYHQVTLSNSFAIQTTEVTQAQYQLVVGTNAATDTSCGSSCPVETVTWHQAVAYCNQLSVREQRPTCFTCSGAGASTSCSVKATYATNIYACKGYRLPTEAEWEYAYRAGTTTPFYSGAADGTACKDCGKVDTNLDKIGWYCSNSSTSLHPVQQKQANPWALYDMAGNVREWVFDWYGVDSLGSATVTNPQGPSSGTKRTIRGGAFNMYATQARASARENSVPTGTASNVGFRCVRSL